MASSNVFSRVLHSIFPLRDFLYVLQLEEYELPLYLRSAVKFWFRRNLERRDTLKWTSRARATGLGTVVIAIAACSAIAFVMPWWAAIIAVLLVFPLWVAVAHVLLLPLTTIAKRRLVARASAHLAKVGQNTKVIAIAGSYGKTTTKYLLLEALRSQYKTQAIEGNINTTLGIANWVLTKFDPTAQVLIVEMDAYHAGEIQASCEIVRPHIAVLTSVGEQHMLRFGTQERMAVALSEVFRFARKDAVRICDAEVAEMLQRVHVDVPLKVVDGLMYRGETIAANDASKTVQQNAALALLVADALDVPASHVRDLCSRFTQPDRRQKPSTMYGYSAIDDSYNISLPTAEAGIVAARALAEKSGKKLLVLTAGIPEFGKSELQERNRAYGAYIAQQADAVVVLKSEFHDAITHGIAGAIPLLSVQNMPEAVAHMPKQFPPSEFVLLVQPELTDLSY